VRALPLLFIVIALVVVLWPMLRRRPAAATPVAGRPHELVKDPVCQTYVVRSRAVSRSTAGGPRYFCSPACASRFAG
jgi:YHS domain-containing protein